MSENIFTRALEVELSAPSRATRVQRINAGKVVATNRDGSRRAVRLAKKGTGDLVGYVALFGTHIEVETKRDAEKQNLSQKRRQRALERAGAIYVVVRWYESAGEALDVAVARAVAKVDEAIARHFARIPRMARRAALRGGSC